MACTVVFITFVLLETSWEVSSYSAANKIDNNIFEDDMIMTEEQYKNNEINRRTGLIEEKFKWSKIEGKVIVPYKFDKPKLWSKHCINVAVYNYLSYNSYYVSNLR